MIQSIYFDLTRIKKLYFDLSYFFTCTWYYWEVYVQISLLAFVFYRNLPHYFEFIRHCYDRIYAYNDSLCVLNYYVSFNKVIFGIYLPVKSPRHAVISNPVPRWCKWMQTVRRFCHAELSRNRHWLFIYEHIHSF